MIVQKVESLRLTTAGFIGLFLHGIIVAAPGAFLPQWTAAFAASPLISPSLKYSD
ncbi:MAG: hypothetical protein RIE73_05255 [Coleofasciculus sp. C1-SOL-03]|jgi:hypothetical protein|uniref:hypothetical protein n=1 Tax=Coleofasciculus sp. C1-SOL-03 TaxID=3069522 RepID=UPI0032FE5872